MATKVSENPIEKEEGTSNTIKASLEYIESCGKLYSYGADPQGGGRLMEWNGCGVWRPAIGLTRVVFLSLGSPAMSYRADEIS